MDIKLNTIDIDLNPRFPDNDLHLIDRILLKITLCPYSLEVFSVPSQHKGVHIFLKCSINCDDCRLVFDDSNRFSLDRKRIPEIQNMMFDEKGKR